MAHGHSHNGSKEASDKPLLASKAKAKGGVGADDAAKRRAKCQLMTAIVFCFVFMCAEVVGGYLADSLAIMTDAAHLLSDVAGLCINVFAIWMSSKPPTNTLSYGYHRVEVLGALASVGLIWLLTGVLVYEAIQRILNPVEVKGEIMFIVACCGLAVNLALMKVLHQGHGHSHGDESEDSHGHSHEGGGGHGHSHGAPASPQPKHHRHVESEKKKKGHGHSHGSMSVRAAFIHAVGDLVQSIGVMIAGALIWWKPEWHIADPLCTFVFSILVLITTVRILQSGVRVLLDSVPDSVDNNCLLADLETIDGVVEAHDLHVWSIGSGKPLLSVHLTTLDNHPNVLRLAQLVSARYGITHTTIQVEIVGTKDQDHCIKNEPCNMTAMRTGCAAGQPPACTCDTEYGQSVGTNLSRDNVRGAGYGAVAMESKAEVGSESDDDGHGHSHGDHHGHSHEGGHGHSHDDHHGHSHGDHHEAGEAHGHSHGEHHGSDHDDHSEHGHSHGDHSEHGHSHGDHSGDEHGHSHGSHGHSHGSH